MGQDINMNKTTKKNIVFITIMPGEVDTSYKEFCLNTWKWWCEKNNVELFILDEELTNSRYMKPTWQRWYVFDILDLNGVNYDQVAMVDVDTMIRWDAPNFFELTDRKFSAVVDQDNIGWVKQSIEAYQHFFPKVNLDWTDYFNCGFVVLSLYKPPRTCGKIRLRLVYSLMYYWLVRLPSHNLKKPSKVIKRDINIYQLTHLNGFLCDSCPSIL